MAFYKILHCGVDDCRFYQRCCLEIYGAAGQGFFPVVYAAVFGRDVCGVACYLSGGFTFLAGFLKYVTFITLGIIFFLVEG